MRYLPWYMTLFLGAYQLPKEMKYEIDLSALQQRLTVSRPPWYNSSCLEQNIVECL
ncbi:MAG: hypothetical protein ACLUNZ_02550 [Evtepia sp.]